jgi:3-hydroxyacyl-[acyl-carrier-protein] dehydratase
MDREQLKELLLHREPMLLVDEAWPDADGRGGGKYTVKGTEWFLQGHFPGYPVVAGRTTLAR